MKNSSKNLHVFVWLIMFAATLTQGAENVQYSKDAFNAEKSPANLPQTTEAAAIGKWQGTEKINFVKLPDDAAAVAERLSSSGSHKSFPTDINGEPYSALLVYESGRVLGRSGDVDLGYVTPPKGLGAWNPDKFILGEDTAQTDLEALTPLSIIGGTLASDRRVRYSSLATLTAYPYRTIGSLSSNGNTKAGGCTGVLVGPRHVLTAAHCLHDSNGNWYSPIYFNPGQTNNNATNGSYKMVARWARDHGIHQRYDYGLIVLEDDPQLAALGWMGMAWWNNTNSYSGNYAYNKGYPLATNNCLASTLANDNCDGWMYGDGATLAANAATNDYLLQYDIDTQTGHSGSPVYYYLNGAPAVLAVHGYGVGSGLLNHGARFRSGMYNDICSWIAGVDSNYATHPNCN